jgi:hypothetical protein
MERLFKGHRIEVENNNDSTYTVRYYKFTPNPSSKDCIHTYVEGESKDIMQAMHRAKVTLRKILKDEK